MEATRGPSPQDDVGCGVFPCTCHDDDLPMYGARVLMGRRLHGQTGELPRGDGRHPCAYRGLRTPSLKAPTTCLPPASV